jgi:predicted metal-dependent phosphoesterase TrpH
MTMRSSFLVLALAALALPGIVAQNDAPALQWYRGNLHTHTIDSDGDSPPSDVVAWYKRNGYQFLALTDHNTYTDPAPFDTNPNDGFLLLGGEEITNAKTVHVNAIGITRTIPAQSGPTVTALLQASIDAVRAQEGIPLINHPNFGWAFTAADMLPLAPLQRAALLEIASGHPLVNHAGDGLVASTERMWDELLSAGARVHGVAVDDAHNFRQEFTRERANPGRAWVVVRAPALTRQNILASLDAGNFYASTGVTLKDVRAAPDSLTVEVEPSRMTGSPSRVQVVFIGKDGRELSISHDSPARYGFAGNEGYVRARIEDSNGLRAWTQPVIVKTPARRQ